MAGVTSVSSNARQLQDMLLAATGSRSTKPRLSEEAPVFVAAPMLARILAPAAVLPPPAPSAVSMFQYRPLLYVLPPVFVAAPVLARILAPASVLPPPAPAAVPMIPWLLSVLPPAPAAVNVPRMIAAQRRPATPVPVRAAPLVGGPRLPVGLAAPAGCRALLQGHPAPVWALVLAVIATWASWRGQRRGVHHACAGAHPVSLRYFGRGRSGNTRNVQC